jgi:hypothetical protein
MKKRKFAEGGGRFDEDVYARARKFLEDQEKRAGEGLALDEEPKPTPRRVVEPPKAAETPKPTPSARSMPSTGRAEIPVDTSMRGPAKQFSSAMEMGDTGRVLSTTVGALGGAGAAGVRAAPMARTAIESAKGVAAPVARAAREGMEVAKTSGPKAGLETARSTLRGMKSRAEMQAKRTERQRGEAKAMEEAKPVLQARRSTKPERAARTRRTEEDMGMEFSRGGSASSRADGCAKRGKTRGKMV